MEGISCPSIGGVSLRLQWASSSNDEDLLVRGEPTTHNENEFQQNLYNNQVTTNISSFSSNTDPNGTNISGNDVTVCHKRRRSNISGSGMDSESNTQVKNISVRDAATSPVFSVSRYMPVEEDDDDGIMCTICMDEWEMSGEHRLSSLKCGHLFGDSCIRRWLTGNLRKCPQCKTAASPGDIRHLYAKRVRMLDRSVEQRLQQELHYERGQTATLQIKLKSMRKSYFEMQTENTELQQTVDRVNRELLYARSITQSALLNMHNNESNVIANKAAQDEDMEFPLSKLYLESEMIVQPEPGCRSMVYTATRNTLLCSCKSVVFPGYAVRFIDVESYRTKNTIWMSGKIIRDITLNADETLLSLVSMEPFLKIYDIRTSQLSTALNNLNVNLWSCNMDRIHRTNLIYLGAQNGNTFVYDIRMPLDALNQFTTVGDVTPVISIEPHPPNMDYPFGGVIVCKLQSLWFFEYNCNGKTFKTNKIQFDGPFLSMRFDNDRQTILVQTRSSNREAKSKFVLGRIRKIKGIPVIVSDSVFEGSNYTPYMTRAAQINLKNNTLVTGYLQDRNTLALYDEFRLQRIQSIPVNDIIYDMMPLYRSNGTYLAALADTKCRIYKVADAS